MELDQPYFQQPQPAYGRRMKNPDRFIPNRSAKPKIPEWNGDVDSSYSRLIMQNLAGSRQQDRMFSFCEDSVSTTSTDQCIYDMIARRAEHVVEPPRTNINVVPEKILDAPELKDDYYLNLLDWSSCGPLAIGLNQKVYAYTPRHISEVCTLDEGYVCSVAFHGHHPLLAVGTSTGRIHLYDVEKQCLLRVMRGHFNRVSSLAFSSVLFSGSKDTTVLGHDIKCPNSVSMRFDGHRGEVCGLKHDPSGLASGSNDNTAIIWDINAGRERYTLTGHKAAVKALAWCPWQRGVLATGGGTTDKTMKFWSADNGKLLNSVNTDSQVCALLWNRNDKEIISSHGYSQNQLCVWKYPQASKIVELHGHTQRVLYMALSPDGETVCSASADETLRFWKVFKNGSAGHSLGKEQSFHNFETCSLR